MFKRIFHRPIWQAVVLSAVIILALLHTLDNAYPSSHSLCPFGGLASLYSLITSGTFIHRVHASALFLLLAVILTALLAGRVFCGWLCPLGTIGEWVNRGGKKLGIRRRVTISASLDSKLRYLKYVVLAIILYLTWTAGTLVYRGWCPWSAFMNIFDLAELVEDVLMGGLILLAIIGISLFIERFFCRYLCPLGAALTMFNRFSIIKPVRDDNCRVCGICESNCSSAIKLTDTTSISHPECIRCYRCLEKCPDKGSLRFNIRGLSSSVVGLLIILVFAGTLFASYQAGYWERGRIFVRGSDSGFAQADVPDGFADIKASTTLRDVATISGLSLEAVYRICSIPASLSPESTLRELREATGMTRRAVIEALSSAITP